MSRGLGIWQRMILEAVGSDPTFCPIHQVQMEKNPRYYEWLAVGLIKEGDDYHHNNFRCNGWVKLRDLMKPYEEHYDHEAEWKQLEQEGKEEEAKAKFQLLMFVAACGGNIKGTHISRSIREGFMRAARTLKAKGLIQTKRGFNNHGECTMMVKAK